MKLYGIEIDLDAKRDLLPKLDCGFVPLERFASAFSETAKEPFRIALGSPGGRVVVRSIRIGAASATREADIYFAGREVKFLLWQVGGCELWLDGDDGVCSAIAAEYGAGGARAFDADFMGMVYGRSFTVRTGCGVPDARDETYDTGRGMKGCRIGFDAGGSDRKVSAVIDGEVVYSEETVWSPKVMTDGRYHVEGVRSAFRAAAEHMPRVDAIGVSSAGIYANNRTLYAQLFGKVPKEQFDGLIRDIYIDAAKEYGEVPLKVANDGDVTALAGALSLGRVGLLGIAMGTSEAAGFVDDGGNIKGWLNELAFAPVDVSPAAEPDDWSGDLGCGYKYFSQEAIIRLAGFSGIDLSAFGTPGEKLKAVQNLLADGEERAADVFHSAGRYLGHSTPLYHRMYGMNSMLLLGRVMSGRGGEILVESAREALHEVYPDCEVEYVLPNEEFRRLGQSAAAASLPDFGGAVAASHTDFGGAKDSTGAIGAMGTMGTMGAIGAKKDGM